MSTISALVVGARKPLYQSLFVQIWSAAVWILDRPAAEHARAETDLRYEGLLEILGRLAMMFDDKPANLARTGEACLMGRLRSSFHEFQHGRGTVVPALRAFPRRLILGHGVAQSLQLRISNPVELHPELEDRE